MQDLIVESTKSTPSVQFQASAGYLQIMGESYPENAAKFYAPVLNWLRSYLAEAAAETTVVFRVTYFNSSSSKAFMTFFDLLEQAVLAGTTIAVRWVCDQDNDIAIECGEEFKEELSRLPFSIEIADAERPSQR